MKHYQKGLLNALKGVAKGREVLYPKARAVGAVAGTKLQKAMLSRMAVSFGTSCEVAASVRFLEKPQKS